MVVAVLCVKVDNRKAGFVGHDLVVVAELQRVVSMKAGV